MSSTTVAGHNGPLQTGKIKFRDLDAASDFADEVVVAQWDLPEDYPGGLFVQRIDDIKISAHELASKMKITVPFFVDLRDFASLSCFVVLEGSALLITLTALPTYMMTEHADLLAKEKVRCTRTEEKTAEAMTSIKEDESHYLKRILIVMPPGLGVSADFTENMPRYDVKVHAKVREKTSTFTTGATRRQVQQVFFNLYWQVRLVQENRQLIAALQGDDHGIDSAFEGMSLGGVAADGNGNPRPSSSAAELTPSFVKAPIATSTIRALPAPPSMSFMASLQQVKSTSGQSKQPRPKPQGVTSSSACVGGSSLQAAVNRGTPQSTSATGTYIPPSMPTIPTMAPPMPTAPTAPMPAPQPVKSSVPKLVPVGTATPQPAPVLSAGTFQTNFDHPGMNLSKFSDSAKRSGSRLANAQQLREERVESAARNRDRKRSAKIARARQLDNNNKRLL
ncbi:hypothetical protein SEMRO_3100_G343740.1 [Seminavis robusta]|uniref:Uncharacterized protein n=1 Tax=Seminavis robusta TaxID=568900 RepID=A0A9N8F2Q2_9STRA|nr:hypothetical protein SEMRO_3100_G343740.1 [Seminavis robusta]|eukprot:Sro3100_g343740.1 n/a (450) ;mRNA; f:4292-5736